MKKAYLATAMIAALSATAVQAADINFSGTDLAAAISGANPTDRILVNTNGPLVIEDILINKNLTIEAGSGFSPVLQIAVDTNANTSPGITVDAATVSLIGLSIGDAGNSTGVDAIQVVNSAVLNFTDSTITNGDDNGIKIKTNGTLNVDGSTISNVGGDGIFIDAVGTLTMNNSTIDGGTRSIQFDSTDPDHVVINVHLTNSNFLNASEEGILLDDNSTSGESTGSILVIDNCNIIGCGTAGGEDGILLDDGDVEFTTLEITSNRISPAGAGAAGIKLDNKWAEVNSSTALIDNNLIWFSGANDGSGIQVEAFTNTVNITNNTIYNFGEGGIVIDRDLATGGTMTINNNLIISWDETLYTAPTDNVGYGIDDELGLGSGITVTNNVLVDNSAQFYLGFTPGAGNATDALTNVLTYVASTNEADADFLARLGTTGSTLSGASSISDWLLY